MGEDAAKETRQYFSLLLICRCAFFIVVFIFIDKVRDSLFHFSFPADIIPKFLRVYLGLSGNVFIQIFFGFCCQVLDLVAQSAVFYKFLPWPSLQVSLCFFFIFLIAFSSYGAWWVYLLPVVFTFSFGINKSFASCRTSVKKSHIVSTSVVLGRSWIFFLTNSRIPA